jgi:phosphopantetheine adenylyltransferase
MTVKDIHFKVCHSLRAFRQIRGEISLRTFYEKLLFDIESVTIKDLQNHMSVVESLILLVYELEEEIAELKGAKTNANI